MCFRVVCGFGMPVSFAVGNNFTDLVSWRLGEVRDVKSQRRCAGLKFQGFRSLGLRIYRSLDSEGF